MKYYRWGSWLFLLGSICLTIDAFVLCFDELTIRSFFYLLGAILFSLGCVCFTIDAQ